MEKTVWKELPDRACDLAVDLAHPNRVLLTGGYRQQVRVGERLRDFYAWLPEGLENCQRCIVAAIPEGTTPEAFMEASGLRALAEEQKLFLFLAVPEGDAWRTDGSDADYLNALYVEIQARDWYVTMQDNIYLAGFGEAAAVAHQAARKMASEWSGLMTVGQLTADLTQAGALASEQDQGEGELKVQAMRAQLPVWMAVGSVGAHEQAALDYWKRENRVQDGCLSGEGADAIFMPSPVRERSEVNDEKIAGVRLTLGKATADEALLRTMWAQIGSARRHRGQGRKILRYFRDPAAMGATLREMEFGGIKRRWYEYVPQRCTANKRWPMVVVMHGRGGTAETFFDISGMSCVAEERGFIAVFPEAGLYQQKKDGLRNVLLWDGIYDGKPIDDVAFIRAMVADIEARLPVDHGRLYACGQSSGGMMTDLLCTYASDLFAACASWSALESPSRMYMQHEPTAPLTPTMFIYGDHDWLSAGREPDPELPFSSEQEIRSIILKKLERYGLDMHDYEQWDCEPITWTAFPNADHVPMLTVGVVHDMIHANYPEESWISFDQFFCQFRRDENGDLYYRGKKVNKA